MNYPRIFERVYLTPLAIHPQRWQSAHAFLMPRLFGEKPLADGMIPQPEARGEPGAPPRPLGADGKRPQRCRARRKPDGGWDTRLYYEPVPGLAVVPIYGALAKNLSDWEEECGGGTDISVVEAALRQVLAARDIKALLLDVDTPGGETIGIEETAGVVAEIGRTRPVYAFSDAGCYSGGMWLVSPADAIYGTPSSGWGSVGTLIAWIDPSLKMEMEGLKLRLYAAGKHKGIGLPGRTMSEEDEDLLRNMVRSINDRFVSAMQAGRPGLAREHMEAQIYTAPGAVEVGMIDGLVSGYSELVELITKEHL